jgi:CheY-like chemotaxis protein
MSARMQDRPTGKLSLAVERLATAARSSRGEALTRSAVVLHEAVVGLNKLLLACARREDDSMFADALSGRLDAAVEAGRAARPVGEEGVRALVVDPERFTRGVIEGFLRREGYHVVGVEDVATALERAAAGPVTLLVVAADPARLDGLGALRRFRSAPETSQAAILFLTPRTDLAEKLAAFQAGADDVVVTPFEPEEVVARVQAMVGRLRRGGTNFAGAAG